ncbi:hypothetical protein DEU56DRAFT_914680 [Suillus clintonianus]|uniref:uncharacterized protein n=1 Tax=Suillus clintonianus TaxID=1904413 RepID=UPI001B861ED4|nr:uncharacterized protein DEU56DRAFT_914680 [Suillus clintonianus]KAG2130675.1 hypothetical protein DEU56DRAFT_914680 [Suillus clintonianus]
MTRPRLYNTPQEKLEATRRYRKTYYDRNSAIISLKHKQKYRARRQVNIHFLDHANAGPQETADPGGPKTTSPSCSQHRHSDSSRTNTNIADVEAMLTRLINGSSTELLDQLVQDFRGTAAVEHWIKSIETLLADVDALRQRVQEYHCATLQSHGVGKEIRQVEFTAGRVAGLTKALEDILMCVMVDPHTLFDHHARGELLYQNSPNITAL